MADKKWWDASLEPKRSFRWEIEYTKGDDVAVSESPIRIPSHYITSVKMPSFSFQKEEQDQIGAKRIIVDPHPTFSPVEITFIDDQENTIYNWIYWYFYNAGIKLDGSGVTTSFGLYNYKGFYSFSKAANFFGSFKIYTLGSELKERTTTVTTTETVGPVSSNGGSTITRTEPGKVEYKNDAPRRTVTTTTSETTSNKYRIDEIELVKPFIVDFKQSDLNYSESGFITYTITINYATYKYSNYSEARELYNSKLGIKYGKPPVSGRTIIQTNPADEGWGSSTEDA